MEQANSSHSSFKYRPQQRLKKRPEFLALQESGKKHYSKHFLLIIGKSAGSESRLGVTITRKVHKSAVHRNQLRRRVREIFRLNLDYVFPHVLTNHIHC